MKDQQFEISQIMLKLANRINPKNNSQNGKMLLQTKTLKNL